MSGLSDPEQNPLRDQIIGLGAKSVRKSYYPQLQRQIEELKGAQEALKRAEVFSNAVIDSIPGLLYLYDEQGRLIRWNLQYERITGFSAEELRHKHYLQCFHDGVEDIRAVETCVAQCLREGYAETEARLQTKQGRAILFHFTAVRMEIGGKRYFAGIGIDITDQKRAENELRRLNRLYATLSKVDMAMVHATSHKELLDLVCDAAIEFGMFTLVWVGKVDPETHRVVPQAGAGPSLGFLEKATVYADDRPEGNGPVGLSIREGRVRVVNDFLAFPGARPWLRQAMETGIRACISLPIRNAGRIYGALVVYAEELNVFQDKEVKLLEEVAADISFALDHLDQEARRQQNEAALKKAKEDAEAANQAKDQFIAVLSHELRTPLTPVLTAASFLQGWEETPDAIKPELEIIRRNVELEARLIDDLLDVTRISRGLVHLHREEVDVHAAIMKTLEICRAEISQKAMELVLRLEAGAHYVLADSARLQQVLWNLVKNALKFTPSEGRITIVTRNVERRIRIEVADTGIGIAPDALPRIFNAFEQGEKTWTRRFGGLGLGLSIAKAVVELHQGSITAFSKGANQGSLFTVELNTVAPGPGLPAAGVAPPRRDARTHRILLVEDNLDTLRIMSRLLQVWGYAVEGAETVAQALEASRRERFDLLISDIGLPDGSGLDIMRALKAVRPEIRGVAISGFGTDEDVRQSQAAGFTEHLTKPVSLEAFRAALDRILAAE